MNLIASIKNRKIHNPIKDIIAGIIVASVSIPIAMGYAQIAGLPAVYGLYGSLLPILIYAFLTTSPQFVVGVDAMPAAMVGGLLAASGIMPQSDEAMKIVPIISLFVAVWFVIFYFAKAGRIVKFISTPVMGGFISGVGITIILMQIPKLFGGSSGTGEIIDLVTNILAQLRLFNPVSFVLGILTIVIILVSKRYIPRVPMTVVMMIVGAFIQYFCHLENYGVALLPDVASGLPKLIFPDFSVLGSGEADGIVLIDNNLPGMVLESLSIAAVIMAQTLLATGGYATKYNDTIDNNKELLAYAGMNLAAGAVGCCPVNGSVSRSKIADNSGARSQLMSISAAVFMGIVLLFMTPILKYLPIPVLTAIVMTALFGIIDVDMLKRLWKQSRGECFIFIASLLAVLALGTVYGVIIGCLLSFWEVAVRAVAPPTSFLGRIPGHGNFHSLERNSHAKPIKNTVIYRFSGNLFFANIERFESDIEKAIKPDTHQVVVDARGIGSVDITSVDRLISFNKKMRDRGIRFYITEHSSELNDSFRELGGESLLNEGVARRTITLALRDAGLVKPYDLEGGESDARDEYMESEERLAEFEWAFGDDAELRLQQLADHTAIDIAREVSMGDADHLSVLENHGATTDWGMLGLFDEHEFWDFLEARIDKLCDQGTISEEERDRIQSRIEIRRSSGMKRLSELNPKAVHMLNKHRQTIMEHLMKRDPDFYKYLKEHMDRRED